MFALEYSQRSYSKLLAMSDEDGFVSVVDTKRGIPSHLSDATSPNKPAAQWRAHQNAVFDLSWAREDLWMFTASGDMTVNLYDTSYARKLAVLSGHRASVKTVATSNTSEYVLASGGRDGKLCVWDVRIQGRSSRRLNGSRSVMPVLEYDNAHSPHDKKICRRTKKPRYTSAPSVTSLCFLPGGSGNVIVSGGVDGCIKLWDVRYNDQPVWEHKASPLEDAEEKISRALLAMNANFKELSHIASSEQLLLGDRSRAITSLAIHPNGSQLLASCIGGHHLLYDIAHTDLGPSKWFGGNSISSFYVKAAFSPDGSHFVSGSSDSNMYLWNVNDKEGNDPFIIEGHGREVTAVAWCPSDFFQIATAADDCHVNVWNVDVRQEAEKAQKCDPKKLLRYNMRLHDQESHGRRPLTPNPSVEAEAADAIVQLTPGPSGTRHSHPRINISNALLQGAIHRKKKMKRVQKTLTEVMKARKLPKTQMKSFMDGHSHIFSKDVGKGPKQSQPNM